MSGKGDGLLQQARSAAGEGAGRLTPSLGRFVRRLEKTAIREGERGVSFEVEDILAEVRGRAGEM